jgi:polygalacturonase
MNRREFLAAASGAAVGLHVVPRSVSGGQAGGSPGEVQGWDQVRDILKRIIPPTFPDREFDITRHGAKGDGTTNCCPAFKAAIEACAGAGGGRVVVPAGTYLANGPIHLLGSVNLHLAEGATILFGTNPDDYLVGDAARGGCVAVRWEGTRCYNYSPLIYACKQRGIGVTGRGTIDGQTAKFWAQWKKAQGPDQQALRGMGTKGTPIEQRVFGRGHFLRPTMFEPYQCENILIDGVTVKASPCWTIHPVECTNVTVRGVNVKPGTTNDDGCDPESCTDVLIDSCTFDTRDDNIAIKAGRDNDAWPEAGGRPCTNVVIRKCTFTRGSPGGISIGSEMSGGVRGVFVEDCTMDRVGCVLYIKSNPDRGGFVENVWLRNVTVNTCQSILRCEMNYKNVTTGNYPPTFRNFHLEGVTCKTAQTAFDCTGLPARPVEGVFLKGITVESATQPARMANLKGLRIEAVKVNGKPLSEE